MATEHRSITTDGDWNNTASWDSGQVPGAGGIGTDTALFDGTSQVSMTTNLDRTSDQNLKRIVTYTEFTGNIGASGNPLKHALASSTDGESRIVHRGTGQFWYEGESGDVQDVFVNSRRHLGSYCMICSGTIRKLVVVRGKVLIESTCNIAQIHTLGINALVTMEAIDSSETDPSIINISAGVLQNARATTGSDYIYVGLHGFLVQTGRVHDSSFIVNNGQIRLEPDTDPSTTHNPALYHSSGSIDQSGSKYVTSFSDLIIGPGAVTAGGALDVGGLTTLGTDLDAREEYP